MPEESFQERTEQATPRRREEARNQGQVARSSELCSVAILLAGLLALSGLGAYMYRALAQFTTRMLTDGFTIQLDLANAPAYILDWAGLTTQVAAPLIIVLAAVALLINFAQVGAIVTGKPLEPKFNRISPLSGIKRLFSARGLVELIKGLFKIAIILYITYLTIGGEAANYIRFLDMEVGQIFAVSGELVLKLGYRILLAMLVLSVLDYAFQRWEFEKNLRMSRQEIKEEFKQQEGDPQVRARVRSLQREMARRRMMEDVPRADVVVTNPTHLAIALRYDPKEMAAPQVVAKGQRLMAQRIKEMARQAGVPLVEDKPLARALFKAVQVGDTVPEELFKAVAQVLAYVYQLKRRKW
ncbi:MAG: flagellar biosynthesis protein FlhB [Candidatus Handelsmanbacteria bacterium]|nr:flagellar biosynthesis protein FlhB [Candidatus Handelsmanbacteria bacterium]